MQNVTGTLNREASTTREKVAGQRDCCHHWVIEPPNGPVSRGQCRYCHAEREFRNSMRGVDPVRQYHAEKLPPETGGGLLRPGRKPIA